MNITDLQISEEVCKSEIPLYLGCYFTFQGPWIEEQKQKNEGIFCRVDPIKASVSANSSCLCGIVSVQYCLLRM